MNIVARRSFQKYYKLRITCWRRQLNVQSFSAGSENIQIVISGASKGIGLEFAHQYLQHHSNTNIIALSRTLSPNLSDLTKKFGEKRLRWIEADLTSLSSIHTAVERIQQQTRSLQLLINVAGVLGDGNPKSGPERSIQQLDYAWMKQSFEVNLFGHVALTQGLFPLLKKEVNGPNTKVINISARVGSIEDNRLGGWYSYRMSKAALNMFTKTLSIETKRSGCIVVSLHPGTTDTDLSRPFQKNVRSDKLFPVEKSVTMMKSVIDSLAMEDTGKFYDYAREPIPY